MDDPDAPGGTWIHWIVFNIDPNTVEIAENSVPKGGIEDGEEIINAIKRGGPCPPVRHRYAQALAGEPSGTHRYFFKLYSLDVVLNLNNPGKETLEKEMQGHIIDKSELIGLYSR